METDHWAGQWGLTVCGGTFRSGPCERKNRWWQNVIGMGDSFSQISTALGKKCLGSLAIWLSLELPKKGCCSCNLFNNLVDMHFIIPLGHRGPVVSPRCIGPGRAGTQTFYYPVIWYNNKIINLYFNVEERPVPQFFPFVQVKHLTKEAKAKLKGL